MVKKYIDLLEKELLAVGLDRSLIARGPTAMVLGLGVSMLTALFRKMAP